MRSQMPKVGLKGHLPFEHNGMLVNNLVYKTNFYQRSDLWHPSYLNSEHCYSNNHGVADGQLFLNQKELGVCVMICDEQLMDYCIWNVTMFS